MVVTYRSEGVERRMGRSSLRARRFVLHGQVEFELGGQFVLGVQPVREIHSSDSTVGMNLQGQEEKFFKFVIVWNWCSTGVLSILSKYAESA